MENQEKIDQLTAEVDRLRAEIEALKPSVDKPTEAPSLPTVAPVVAGEKPPPEYPGCVPVALQILALIAGLMTIIYGLMALFTV